MRLLESHEPSQGFDGLTWDDSVFFFFPISLFNIRLIEN